MISAAGLSEEDFVKKMNDKAKSLGLSQTVFFDPTGLDARNVSTAKEVAVFLQRALSIKEIRNLATNSNYKFKTKQGASRQVFSTNELLDYSFPDEYNVKIIGGKTGYNDRAGYCFGTEFVLNNTQEYISVVLNASTMKNRFLDTKKLLEKICTNF
jgi:D-alanyl-D-alanine carboxypeptidase